MGKDDEIREESSEDVAGGFDQRTADYEGLARRIEDVMGRLDDYYAGIVRYHDHDTRERFLQAMSLFGIR